MFSPFQHPDRDVILVERLDGGILPMRRSWRRRGRLFRVLKPGERQKRRRAVVRFLGLPPEDK